MTSRRRSRARAGRAAALACIVVLAGVGLRFAGEMLLVARSLDRPDAIVVLASHEWERLPVAAALARRHREARVLLTQPRQVTEHNCHECAGRVEWLRRAGIDPERVTVLPELVTNTYDEAHAAATFAGRERLARLLVVTSPYHGRRALATFQHQFRRAGADTQIGLATTVAGIHPASWWRWRYDRDYVAYEWAGIVYYGMRFGVTPLVPHSAD